MTGFPDAASPSPRAASDADVRRALELVNQGISLRDSGHAAQGARAFEAALSVDADCVPALIGLGEFLAAAGNADVAVECYLAALRRDPRNVVARVNLAALRHQAGCPEDAVALLEPIADSDVAPATIRFQLANALVPLGRFDDAVALYESILPLHPQPAKILYNLAQIVRFRDEHRPWLAEWDQRLVRRPQSRDDAAYRHFAIGKASDDLRDYDAAWSHFEAGNELIAPEFDADQHSEFVRATRETFDAAWFAGRQGLGNSSDAPVFIVGMPRSGTSLIEHVLAGHPRVRAAGEREDLGLLVAEFTLQQGRSLDDPAAANEFHGPAVSRMAERYLRRVPLQGAARITDKQPTNFLLLGWIAACFPHARVIHCRRDPLDACLSCYFQHFSSRLPFAYRLESLGAYYAAYERLMSHWRRTLPIPIHDVVYEEFVDEPERVSRDVVEFLGLEWSPACLETAAARQAVATASQWQVRQPVYRSARGRWRNYESNLGPLIAALQDHRRQFRDAA
ncbi:MAG: sulfotransferase [Planctomyces sp.]|nr:sulfotransferase [Planctomyces sp.]